ncbi:MAG: MBL fold metallo-hydrolase [Erysipelotrichaceae bacterium]
MKIKMIGTGSITSSRANSSVLIDDCSLIDCGNGIYKQLLKAQVNPFLITSVYISHLHADHFFDLPFLILNRSFINPDNELAIYGPRGITKALEQLFMIGYQKEMEPYTSNGRVVIEEFDSLSLRDHQYKVESVRVKHYDSAFAYGFNVSEKQKRVFIGCDSCLCSNVESNIAFCSLAILDCTFAKGNKAHMGVNDIQYLLREYERPIIVSHLSNESESLLSEITDDNLRLLDDLAEIEL